DGELTLVGPQDAAVLAGEQVHATACGLAGAGEIPVVGAAQPVRVTIQVHVQGGAHGLAEVVARVLAGDGEHQAGRLSGDHVHPAAVVRGRTDVEVIPITGTDLDVGMAIQVHVARRVNR